MKKRFFIFFFVTLTFSLNSCSLDDGPNFHFLPLQIVSADLPDSFTLNETYQVQVTYNQPDGCTAFAGFEVTDEDTTVRNVVVIGTRRIDQDNCTEAITERTATFNFTVRYEEPYTFRFWQSESENGEQQYLEVVVPVN